MIHFKTIDGEIVGSSEFKIMIIHDKDFDDFDIMCNDVILASFGNVRTANKVRDKIWDQIERGKTTINMEDLV